MEVISAYSCSHVRAFNKIHNPVLFLSCFRITATVLFESLRRTQAQHRLLLQSITDALH